MKQCEHCLDAINDHNNNDGICDRCDFDGTTPKIMAQNLLDTFLITGVTALELKSQGKKTASRFNSGRI